MFIIGVYIDDIVLAGESTKKIEEMKHTLSTKFNMNDLGELNQFLGVQVNQDHDKGTVWIGQPQYTDVILEKFGMDQSKSIMTSVNTNLKLKKLTEESELADEALYQSAVGSLLYLSVHSITNNIIKILHHTCFVCIYCIMSSYLLNTYTLYHTYSATVLNHFLT